jgi:hypothetical protein
MLRSEREQSPLSFAKHLGHVLRRRSAAESENRFVLIWVAHCFHSLSGGVVVIGGGGAVFDGLARSEARLRNHGALGCPAAK